ncbi:MAG: response regulator transcription factor [Bacteroidota bacterium]
MQKPIKCIIVDDEEMATKVIETHLSHIPDFEIAGIYHSAVEAFLALDQYQVDVLFLDIQMPKITGIDMIKMLKTKPLVVLTTAHREFALEGFELDVVDYLLKPIGLNRFLQTVSRIKKQLQLPELNNGNHNQPKVLQQLEETADPDQDYIFVKTNRAYQKIDFETILHIEAIKNHIKIVTKTETHISLMTLSKFEALLPEQFLRVHRSFIINTDAILKFDSYSIKNAHGDVPIGRTYKDEVTEKLRQLL